MPFFVSRGQKLHYEVLGEGRPIVLLHGVTNYGMVWTPQLSRLLYEGYRIIIPDLAGHGMSQPAAAKTTVPELAVDLAALLDEVKEPQAAICGLSLGGMVAQQFACDHPSRTIALLLPILGLMRTPPNKSEQSRAGVQFFRSPMGHRGDWKQFGLA